MTDTAYETWKEQLRAKQRRIGDLIVTGDRLMQAARNCAVGCAAKTPERRELQDAIGEWIDLREKP